MNARDAIGWTALHHAAVAGHESVVKHYSIFLELMPVLKMKEIGHLCIMLLTISVTPWLNSCLMLQELM